MKNLKTNKGFFSGEKLLAIYTMLSILLKMKRRLGLESMLEYIENYCFYIERDNPKLKHAVNKALDIMGVEKLHREVIRNEGL